MSPPVPVLMRPGEITSVQKAAEYYGKSEKTIRRLCAAYGLARQTSRSAPLEISKVALEMAMAGDMPALELFRDGHRGVPEVRRYLNHLGFPV